MTKCLPEFIEGGNSQDRRGVKIYLMNKLQKKAISIIATAATLVYTAAPALAVTIEISGNNTDTTNQANVDLNNSTYVSQSNNANIDNDVDASASTGGNEIKESAGGEASIETGEATTDVTVVNSVNSNAASVEGCGSCASDVDVLISGNSSDSYNKVDLDVNNEEGSGVAIFQDNHADVDNDVDASSSTGKNEIEEVTGGDSSIDTGDATTTVTVSTFANANSAVLSGGQGGSGLVSLKILGNGTDTTNKIYLDLDRSVYLSQDNNGHIDNDVDASSSTGKNEIEEAAGGEVSIDTGNADTTVTVDNMVNFNWANVDCDGCLWDLTAKIAGNNSDSENKIKADLEDEVAVFQDNCGLPQYEYPFSLWFGGFNGGHHKCGVDNDVDAYAKTGYNEAEEVVGSHDGDPSVDTGDAATTVEVGNSGNVNVYGEAPDWDWELPLEGFNLNLTLDLSELLAFLHLA